MITTDNIDLKKRQMNLIRIICLFWLFTKFITAPAWTGMRQLPVVPFIDFLDDIPVIVHTIIYAVCIILLVCLIFRPLKWLMVTFFVVEVISVLLDAIRLQPWEYLYLFIVFFCICTLNQAKPFFRILIFVLASTYFFSGMHKLGPAFLKNVWESLVLRRIFGVNKDSVSVGLHYLGLSLGVVELLFGFSLVVTKFRRFACYGLIAMHLIILISLGLVLNGFNYSVYPWNVLMIFMLFKLSNIDTKLIDKEVPYPITAVVFIFWLLLPLSNFMGYWGHYLSSGMYTGKTPRVYLCVSNHVAKQMHAGRAVINLPVGCDNSETLSISRWVEQQTAVTPFPQHWYYNKLGRQISLQYTTTADMYYIQYPDLVFKEMR